MRPTHVPGIDTHVHGLSTPQIRRCHLFLFSPISATTATFLSFGRRLQTIRSTPGRWICWFRPVPTSPRWIHKRCQEIFIAALAGYRAKQTAPRPPVPFAVAPTREPRPQLAGPNLKEGFTQIASRRHPPRRTQQPTAGESPPINGAVVAEPLTALAHRRNRPARSV